MSPDVSGLVIAAAVGTATGVIFFAGLYATTRRVATAKRPATLVVASFVGRTAVAVAAAWFAARWAGLGGVLVYLAGFTGARIALLARVRRHEKSEVV